MNVEGSYRTLPPGSNELGRPDSRQQIEVTLRLRSGNSPNDWSEKIAQLNSTHFSRRHYLDRRELAARHRSTEQDVAAVTAFAAEYSLRTIRSITDPRAVKITGALKDFEAAFGVDLRMFEFNRHIFRGRKGHLTVPAALSAVITGVFGLDNRPIARSRVPGRTFAGPDDSAGSSRRSSSQRGLKVSNVARIYGFPTNFSGSGQCIALVELNSVGQHNGISGGYLMSDIAMFAKSLSHLMPAVEDVLIDGGVNSPGKDLVTDHEVTMDIEVATAVAPDAKIVVYFAPNNDAGFINALGAAVHDPLRKPAVVSVSWGITEEHCTDQLLTGLTEILEEAAAVGVTVCCSTGDFGSSDGLGDGLPHVEFPASSPFALACGGTKLVSSGTKIKKETVWNDGRRAGGGGVSTKFTLPGYQRRVEVPLAPNGTKGRGVPDVVANAVGYKLWFQGNEVIGNGTSAVAPLWAGLIALFNQALASTAGKPVGLINPLLYALDAKHNFRGVTTGTNDLDGKIGKYAARKGWNPCCGLGSPQAARLLQSLEKPR